jgi:Transposase DDE domain
MQSIDIFERLVEKAPLAVSTRMLLENLLRPELLDAVFERTAKEQYTRKVLFSDIVALMGTVVQRMHPSVHAAFRKSTIQRTISLASFYDKLNGIEPIVSAAVVEDHAQRASAIIDSLQASLPPLVPGYATRIVDGNAIAATDHRLEVLRDTRSGALPGKSLVVLDSERDLVTTMIPCEDGHAQERSLSDALLRCVHAGELWIADRNFCTTKLLCGIADRQAAFLIREHRGIPLYEESPPRPVGDDPKASLREQEVTLQVAERTIRLRRILLKLPKATRDGDREIVVLTTLPRETVDAQSVMETYRKRWTIETMFRNLTTSLQCEVSGLGNPRAALFAFAIALVSANTLATIRAALRSKHGDTIEERVSIYQVVDDLQATYRGVEFWHDEVDWGAFAAMPSEKFLTAFLSVIEQIDLRRYPKAKTRPRKPRSPRGSPNDPPHVSTHRLLEARKRARSAQKHTLK